MMRFDLDGLEAISREVLMSEWREVVGRPPPKHLSRSLMIQILSHTYQINMVGGYLIRQHSANPLISLIAVVLSSLQYGA